MTPITVTALVVLGVSVVVLLAVAAATARRARRYREVLDWLAEVDLLAVTVESDVVDQLVARVRALPRAWQLEVARRLHERLDADERATLRAMLGDADYLAVCRRIGVEP